LFGDLIFSNHVGFLNIEVFTRSSSEYRNVHRKKANLGPERPFPAEKSVIFSERYKYCSHGVPKNDSQGGSQEVNGHPGGLLLFVSKSVDPNGHVNTNEYLAESNAHSCDEKDVVVVLGQGKQYKQTSIDAHDYSENKFVFIPLENHWGNHGPDCQSEVDNRA
jgi:hypothetical protein